MRVKTKVKGYLALWKIKRAQKKGVLPPDSFILYRAIKKAGL